MNGCYSTLVSGNYVYAKGRMDLDRDTTWFRTEPHRYAWGEHSWTSDQTDPSVF